MEKQNLTIAFITEKDPNDRKSFSGTHYRMLHALKENFTNVIALGPVNLPKFLEKILNTIEKIQFRLLKKRYNKSHNYIRSFYYGYFFKKKLKTHKADLIFAPAASVEIACLKTKVPICYLSDTSFKQISEYYIYFSNFSKISVKESNQIEQRAINNSACQVYSSDWAADFVKLNYQAKNVHIVKFGANIDKAPDKFDIVKTQNSVFQILFLGVDWIRKGGDIVIETIKILDEKGYDFHLTVCGCAPSEAHPKMTVIPFLDKNKEEERLIFENLLCKTNLLFVPTRADCTPIVFCEANAYGIPVITTDTGGVKSLIEDGVNGYALPFDANANNYAEKIMNLFDNPSLLNDLTLNSRRKYEEELNWDNWGKKMTDILIKLV